MEMVKQRTIHLGTDELRQVNRLILENFKKIAPQRNVQLQFKFSSMVQDIYDMGHGKEIMLKGKQTPQDTLYDEVIVSVGRYGQNLLKRLKRTYNYFTSDSKVDLGVRIEIPSDFKNIKELDQLFYE